MDEYALSVCNPQGVSSPTIVGAQAANELLNVKNVKASFVCTPYNDQVYISARSILPEHRLETRQPVRLSLC